MNLTEKEILTILQNAHSVPLGSPIWESGEEYNKLVNIIESAVDFAEKKNEHVSYSDFLPVWKKFISGTGSVLNVQMVAHYFYNLGFNNALRAQVDKLFNRNEDEL